MPLTLSVSRSYMFFPWAVFKRLCLSQRLFSCLDNLPNTLLLQSQIFFLQRATHLGHVKFKESYLTLWQEPDALVIIG